ncbi:hypothetical protein ES708_00727 [subsurface metagenome]
MRKIKVKAWIVEEKRMAEVLTLSFDSNGVFAANLDAGKVSLDYMSDEFILLQHTSLKDKNGVEIYEGDRVRCGDHAYVCMWNEYRGEFAWYCDGGYICPIGDMRTELEVIGNIHDPELLEERHREE